MLKLCYECAFKNVFKVQIRGISSIKILKWIIIIKIMWLISLNLAFKITSVAIFFIVTTIATIVATIIVFKILFSSGQCCDKPKSTHTPIIFCTIFLFLAHYAEVGIPNKMINIDYFLFSISICIPLY